MKKNPSRSRKKSPSKPRGAKRAPIVSESTISPEEMLPEYDFRGGVRGRYAARYAEGSNVVLLDADVATSRATTPASCTPAACATRRSCPA
jgi:hypothetical protein